MLEGRCRAPQVKTYLESLVQQALKLGKTIVIILDNAGFHRAKLIKKELEDWEAKGLTLWFQPPYSPQCNLIETICKKLKAFLVPRRYYQSREQLQQAVLDALDILDAKAILHS